ncbi:MAG: FtsX-like permease family protein, partial [Gemmatimonadetes bacterium]|nr:FtsX-like permease family protein [Gemmatimonadota bacterium]
MMVGKAFPYSVNLAGRVDPWLSLVGRLEPGVTPEQAQSSLDAISLSLQEEYPSQNQGKNFPVVEFSRNRLGQGPDEPINLFMALLMGVVGLVLLIACFNVANLFLARATTRHREIALRISVGAGRRTIIRQLLVESIMISMVAGGLGLLIALWGGDLFSLVLPQGEVPLELDLSFDRRVFLFTFVLAVATGVLFGLFPALQTTRAGQFSALKDGPFLMNGGKSRLQSLLVIGQVALSLVLLVGAGLFVRSLQHTLDVDPGFALKDGLVVPVNLGYGQYTEEEGRLFFARIAEQVAGLPGVERVAQTAALPLGQMHGHHYIYIEGYDPAPGEFMLFKRNKVGAEYLATMGMEVVAGRGIDDRDREDTNPVMVVNETFVRRFFPDGNALGRMVAADLGVWREVVGVVEDGKYSRLDEPPEPYLMIPLSQAEYLQRRYLVIESSGDPTSLMAPVRQYLSELDPGLPVTIMTMEDHLKLSTGDAKGGAVLVGIFGLLAVVLAMVGVYGVMSYTVTQRINEFGVRMALGADRQSIVWTVLGWGARTTLVGVIAG